MGRQTERLQVDITEPPSRPASAWKQNRARHGPGPVGGLANGCGYRRMTEPQNSQLISVCPRMTFWVMVAPQ